MGLEEIVTGLDAELRESISRLERREAMRNEIILCRVPDYVVIYANYWEGLAVPQLVITYVGGQYEMIVANTGSVQLADAPEVVTWLAEAMQGGVEVILAQSEFIFAAGQLTEEMVAGIFGAATELYLEAQLVFTAAEGLTLLEVIADAGAALLAVLV